MEGVVAEAVTDVSVLDRRGLQCRPRRDINVRKTLGEEVSSETRYTRPPDLGGPERMGQPPTLTTGASSKAKFQPKLYVPERLRKAADPGPTPQYGSSISSVSSPSSHEGSLYTSRVIRGREQPAAEQSHSVLSTTRGFFQLRQRRNIRVKSFDELEHDTETTEMPKTEIRSHTESGIDAPSSYNTGFVRTAPVTTTDRLARRSRQTVTDMLGSTSVTPIPRYESNIPSGYTQGALSGYTQGSLSGYTQGINDMTSLHQPLAIEPSYDHEPQLAIDPIMDRDISHSIMPEFVRPYQPGLLQYSPQNVDISQETTWPPIQLGTNDQVEHYMQNGCSEVIDDRDIEQQSEFVDPASENIMLNRMAPSGVELLSNHSYIPGTADPSPYHHITGHAELNKPRLGEAMHLVSAPRVPIAGSLANGEPPLNETVDEKKERILRVLMQRKMEAAAAARPSNPNFETLEEKKERIFANLRQKHGSNVQAAGLLDQTVQGSRLQSYDILGLSTTKSPYSRSYSLGDALDTEPRERYGAGYRPETHIIGEDIFSRPETHTIGEDIFSRPETHTIGEDIFSRPEYAGMPVEEHRYTPTSAVPFMRRESNIVNAEPGIYKKTISSGTNQKEDRRGSRTSPIEDVGSVDSGFHGGDGTTRDDGPTTNSNNPMDHKKSMQLSQTSHYQQPRNHTSKEQMSQEKPREKTQPSPAKVAPKVITKVSPTAQSQKTDLKNREKQVEKQDEDSSEETLIRPSDVKAAAGNLLLKKSGPATKPKTGSFVKSAQVKPPMLQTKAHQSRSHTPTKSQPPRPKSAPPSKSKSIANLSEMPISPRMERRASTSTRDDMADISPFSRNSRLRSSTRAWELRQAEKQAEIRSRASGKPPITSRPTTPKKPVITGQVSLSPERATTAAKDKLTHTARMASQYEKPWRTGTTLAPKPGAGSFTIRSAQTNILSEKPKKQPADSSSNSSSRAESPSGRPRNPVKESGSVVYQGCLRSQTNKTKSSPCSKSKQTNQKSTPSRPSQMSRPRRTTTPKPFSFSYVPRLRRSSVSSDAGSDATCDLDDFIHEERLLADEQIYLEQLTQEFKSNVEKNQSRGISPDSGWGDHARVMTPDSCHDDLVRGVSPDSGLSVHAGNTPLPPRDLVVGDDVKPSLFTNWIHKPTTLKMDNNSLDTEDAISDKSCRDEAQFARPVGIPKGSKRSSRSAHTGGNTGTLGRKSTGSKSAALSAGSNRKRPGSGSTTRTGSAGAVDQEFFIKNFEDVKKVHLFSAKELNEQVSKIKDILSDASKDWEKRVEALKEVRAIMIAGGTDYDEFTLCLRHLEPCMVLSAKDLRSQVVREAAVTIAYLSQQLGNKCDHFAEAVFPTLISLIPNSAKIMSTSGTACIRFIIQHTHAPRLIPIFTSSLSSKSNVIRRECLEVLGILLQIWPTHTLERHIALLQEAIKKGITDADSEARAHARKAYWGFAEHFRDQAESLLNTLDPTKQKMLQGEVSNSSSNNSLSSGGTSRQSSVSSVGSAKSTKSRSRSMSSDRSNQLYSRTLAGPNPPARRPMTPKAPSAMSDEQTDGARSSSKESSSNIARSSSAVDLTGSMTYRGTTSLSRTPAKVQSNYSSLRFRNLRQMKAFKRKGSGDGSAEDLTQLGANRQRTLSASDLTNPQSHSTSRSSADLLATDQSSKSLPRSPRKLYNQSSVLTSRPKKSTGGSNMGQSMMNSERSRARSKIGISQSQPGSRSTSPSSRLSYLTHVQTNTGSSSRQRSKTGIPRSQGASRETSPSRIPYGRERRLSGSSKLHTPASRVTKNGTGNVLTQQLLQPGQDIEAAVADALFRGGSLRRKYESYDSDDAASETSSVCSERSFSSYSKTSEDMSEIISNLSSGSWADRKEGLVALQNLLRGNRLFNRLELKKITEIFTRMFHDPHGKVFSVFMETLMELVAAHRADLHDWLYVCLTRLINKMGADLLGSVQVKVQRALDAVRDSFPYNHQFHILNRFIVDQTQTPNLKVKVALLNYMHGLALLMDPTEFVNTSDTRLAVSRIITWTTEPKSVDVRKVAQAVLIALFNLNSPEFSMMLSVLPKTFQDGATKILHNHLRSASQEAEPLAPRNITSPTYGNRYRPPPNRRRSDDVDTENMNPEDIYNSIKKASADIQNLSKLDSHYDDIKKERDSTSQDSGIQGSTHDLRGTSPDVKDALHRGRQYNPSYYQDDSLNGYDKLALREAVFDVDNDLIHEGFNEDLVSEQSDIVADILKELSNHNTRTEERTNAMLSLIKITREGSAEVWDEHFKTILLLLLETLGDSDGHIRALALRVLREILRHQPDRFMEYAELTILKILEAHKDPVKEVSRAAEECATTLAHSIPAEQCIRVLNPIIQTAEFPVNLAAIKMQTKVLEHADKSVLDSTVSEVIPGLLQGYDDQESSVRKASVFCLVAIYMVISDELKPHVQHLSGSKMKLLNLYIKRSLSEKGQTGPGLCSTDTSKTTSPASTVADLLA